VIRAGVAMPRWWKRDAGDIRISVPGAPARGGDWLARRTSIPLAWMLAASIAALSAGGAKAWVELGPIAADTDWIFEDDGPDPAERDPFEPLNRGIFGCNEVVYTWVFDPFATAYEWVVPGPGRRAVRRFFSNLSEPVTLVNDLLQLEPVRAGSTGARFLINSTAGVAGLFDPATAWGIDRHASDFGGTLAVYRLGSGPYIVIPVMGPSTLRDAIGGVIDGLIRPDTWLLTPGTRLVISASDGFTNYGIERARMDALRDTSVDFYAALRSAYLMDRDARIEALIASD
jgi:phospholipid-binding lipoprotein MlaA